MLFEGVATALVTPFDNGGIDFPALADLLSMQLEGGVNAVVILGTTGEPATMSADEKKRVIEFAVSRLKGKIPVIVGAGSNSTAKAIEECQTAEKLGADGALVVTPYYNKCTQEGLVRHYLAIADSVNMPIVCYNVPSRTGVNLLPSTFATIAEHKNIVGVKEASGNMEQIMQTIALSKGKATVYSGDDALAVPTVAIGGRGVISVASNVYPKYVASMLRSALDGNFAKAAEMQLAILPAIKALFSEVNPIPVKRALADAGIIKNELRLPLTPMSSSSAALLARALTAFSSALGMRNNFT